MSLPKPQTNQTPIPSTFSEMLDKYIEYGTAQFEIPEILKVPPIANRGTVREITALFGNAAHLRAAVAELQTLYTG